MYPLYNCTECYIRSLLSTLVDCSVLVKKVKEKKKKKKRLSDL